MIKGLKVLALITARGGSKGLPGKNIIDLAGKPLIAWTIEAALKSHYIDQLVVSSDDVEIIKVAKKFGCDAPFIRPDHLSTDEATSLEVIIHTLEELPNFDLLVNLQPTSPLRNTTDIDAAIEHLVSTGANSCTTLTEPNKSPYWCYKMHEDTSIEPLIDKQLAGKRRQDLPKSYVLNGAVYAGKTNWIKDNHALISDDCVGHVMPHARSYDIDDKTDLLICAVLMADQ